MAMKMAAATSVLHRFFLPGIRVNCGQFRLRAVALRKAFASNVPQQDNEEMKEARKWLSSFTLDSIPKQLYVLSFARSSGPGGQNVNKLNTKAILRFDLEKASHYIPNLIMSKIRADHAIGRYMTKHDELLIHSDTYRHQADNASDCLKKLHQAIVQAAALPGETSTAQRDRVSRLQSDENQRRMQMKKKNSSKKSSRRSKGEY